MNTNKPYYHGSARQIPGNHLMPYDQWNSVQNTRVCGAFVTSDIDYAKFFALNKCISGPGQVKLDNKKIYLERLADKIKPHFYVYTVYETPDLTFIHDRGTEYYSETPIKIAEIQKYNTGTELDELGFEVYVLDEPFNANKDDMTHAKDNSARQNYMSSAIQQGKYHRVNITKLLQQQKNNTLKNAMNKFLLKVHSLSNWLQNSGNSNA